MEAPQISPSRDPSLAFMKILRNLVEEYGKNEQDKAMRIAACITDVLHSIKAMVNSISYSGDFWRIILPEIMFLFDSPLVVIRIDQGGRSVEYMNAWPQEYSALVDVSDIERYRTECILKQHIRRFLLDQHNTIPFRDLGELERKYKEAVGELSKGEEERSNERSGIIEELSMANLESADYPIRRARLFSIRQLVIIPIMEVIEMGTQCQAQGTVEIYLDDRAGKNEEELNAGNQLMQDFLLKEKNDGFVKDIFGTICGLETGFSSGESEIVNYSLLDDKERFLSFIGDIDGKPAGEQIRDFAKQFQEEFVFINKPIAEIWSKAVKKIGALKDNKDKSETERNDYLSFSIGEYYQGKIVHSYFLPSVDDEQSRSPLQDAVNDMPSFAFFKKLWMEPFDQDKSVMGYISYAGGFPEYVVDIDRDIRVAAYQSRVGELERIMIGFSPKFALEIPILSKSADEASRQYELRVAMVYFSKDPVPLKMRWFLYDLAHDSKEAIRTALRDQEEHRKKALEQRAEDWMDMAAGLSHSITNYARGIKDPLALVDEFSRVCSDDQWKRISENVRSGRVGERIDVEAILESVAHSPRTLSDMEKIVFVNHKMALPRFS